MVNEITSEDLKMGPLELFIRASHGNNFKIYIAKKGDEIPSSFGDPEYVDEDFQEWQLTNMRAINSRINEDFGVTIKDCLLYTSPSPRDQRGSRMPSSA